MRRLCSDCRGVLRFTSVDMGHGAIFTGWLCSPCGVLSERVGLFDVILAGGVR